MCLELQDNEFTELPQCIFQIKALQSLIIDSNHLQSIPAAVKALQNLSQLCAWSVLVLSPFNVLFIYIILIAGETISVACLKKLPS
jgi:hypothetical protein